MATITPVITNLPPPPVRTSIQGKDGNMSTPWVQWFQLIWNRTGGSTGAAIYEGTAGDGVELTGTDLQFSPNEQEQVTRLLSEPPFQVPPEHPPEEFSPYGLIQAVLDQVSSTTSNDCCTFDYIPAGETLTLAPHQQYLVLNSLEVAGTIDNNGGTLGVLM